MTIICCHWSFNNLPWLSVDNYFFFSDWSFTWHSLSNYPQIRSRRRDGERNWSRASDQETPEPTDARATTSSKLMSYGTARSCIQTLAAQCATGKVASKIFNWHDFWHALIYNLEIGDKMILSNIVPGELFSCENSMSLNFYGMPQYKIPTTLVYWIRIKHSFTTSYWGLLKIAGNGGRTSTI